MSTKTLLLSLITFGLGEDYIPKDCNYAAVGGSSPFYFPIDACESDITGSTTYSFKYICNDNDTIEKYMYSTFDCEGTQTETITNMTELEIAHYSCSNALSCEYAVVCSFLECNTNSSDTECNLCSDESYSQLLTENHDTHCRPYIKDQCIGSNLSFAYSFECEGGVLSEYYKGSCDNAGFVLSTTGADDTTCLDENDDDKYAYYTVDCDPFVVEPDCNYVGTTAHFYPVGACESDIIIESGDIYSFRYICDGNMIIKEYYDTFGCEGDIMMNITNLTGEVENYQCRSPNGNCAYAMACSYENCGNVNDTTCSQCSDPDYDDSLRQNHNTQCRPYITGECFGNTESGFFKKSTCSGGELTEGFYGDGCTDDSFILPGEILGGDGMCQEYDGDGIYTYYEVDCNPDIIEPECNYAATGTHNYPIGACETDINATTGEMVSFKYVCNYDDEVEMEVYNTWDCYGAPNSTVYQSDLALEDYQCRSKYGDCSYAVGCSFSDCGTADDTKCNSCSGLDTQTIIQTHDTHCFPYITNQCFGTPTFQHQSVCVNGKNSELTESFYFGPECSADYYGFGDIFGGDSNKCIDDNWDDIYSYYQIDCEPDIIQPECNYASGKFGHFYPINACESDNIIINGTTYKSSFKYVCTDDGDIELYTYSTRNCEGGNPTITTPDDIEHHQCKARRDCNYAIVCSYDDCNTNSNDTSCSICSQTNYIENDGDNHGSHCFPYITEGCFGIKDELLTSSTCLSGVFTESLYFGYPSLRECTNDTYSESYVYGGVDTSCQDGTYYQVDCIIAPTSVPTSEPTYLPTDEPTPTPSFDESGANIISICVAFIFVNIILFISF